jgi:hypothetical protein
MLKEEEEINLEERISQMRMRLKAYEEKHSKELEKLQKE